MRAKRLQALERALRDGQTFRAAITDALRKLAAY